MNLNVANLLTVPARDSLAGTLNLSGCASGHGGIDGL